MDSDLPSNDVHNIVKYTDLRIMRKSFLHHTAVLQNRTPKLIEAPQFEEGNPVKHLLSLMSTRINKGELFGDGPRYAWRLYMAMQ